MKTIEVDFNRLARNGKIQVWKADIGYVALGESVLLVEDAEDMMREAYLAEYDDDWAYFQLVVRSSNRTSATHGGSRTQASPTKS